MIPWEKIKAHWRKEFNKVEIYVDENEHILIFKEKNEFIILGYLHYNDKFWTSAQHIIDFIDFIKILGKENYNPFRVFLLCNSHLSDIKKPEEILTLPQDVEYYYVNYNWFYETIEFKVEDIAKSAQSSHSMQQIRRPWYHKKGIPVIEDERFEDWDKWAQKGYEREWYEINEYNKFDSYWSITSIISVSSVYIDDRFIWGFYVVWKRDDCDF